MTYTTKTCAALDAVNHDRYMGADYQLARYTATADVVAQAIRCRLKTMLGEWYQDPSIGIDYLGSVLIKSPDVAVLQRLFAGYIGEAPGVQTVNKVVVTFDGAARVLKVNFEVTAGDGTIVAGGV